MKMFYIYLYVFSEPEFQLGRFLWNARVIKSPDEWAITKQACKSEKYIFSVFSPIAIWGKSLPSSTVKRKNQYSDFLYIYSTALMRPRGPKKYCLQLYICIPCSLALSTTCLACCELISFIQALTVASFITRLSPSFTQLRKHSMWEKKRVWGNPTSQQWNKNNPPGCKYSLDRALGQ